MINDDTFENIKYIIFDKQEASTEMVRDWITEQDIEEIAELYYQCNDDVQRSIAVDIICSDHETDHSRAVAKHFILNTTDDGSGAMQWSRSMAVLQLEHGLTVDDPFSHIFENNDVRQRIEEQLRAQLSSEQTS